MREVAEQMKAVAIDQYGGPEVMTIYNPSIPEVGDDEVLIHVEVAGVGVWDALEREGKLIMGETWFPRILGAEGAGTIVTVGKNVSDFGEDDRVYGFGFQSPKGGFYAEYIVLPANLVALVPEKLSVEEAGAMPVDSITALCGLEELQLGADQKLLIWGASGGIGHIAVQLAKNLGAQIFAVASGEDGVEFVRGLGADVVVDGRKDDVLAAARQFAPEGLDAALLTAGGDAAQSALDALKSGGKVAFPHGVQPEPQASSDITVHPYDGRPTSELLQWLNNLIESGPFEVKVARTYPLEEAASAHRDLGNHYLGKIALTV